jgi:opacity protein-like surface antigen
LQLLHAELVSTTQSPDRSSVARFGLSGDGMKLRCALTLAGIGLWGLGASATPAAAHPPPDDYIPYQPSGFFVLDWSGFYVGGHLGLAHTLAESTLVAFRDNTLFFRDFTFGESETSATGGVQAGWQRQWGKMVAGVELDFNLLRFRSTSDAQVIPGIETALLAAVTRTSEVSDIFLLTGRLGYVDGRWHAYMKGGLANGQVDVSYRDAITGFRSSSGGRETGWTAGLGIDYALTPNLFLGIEYNYIHFRSNPEPPPIPQTEFGAVDIDTQNVVLRLNYKFTTLCCIRPLGSAPP